MEPEFDANLTDICISMSAVPTYFRPHSFETVDSKGQKLQDFILVDGGGWVQIIP